MTAEHLFDSIPPDWEITTLGQACARAGGDIQTGPFGSQLHASDYLPVGVPSIMPQNIGDNRVNAEGIARIGTKDAQRLRRYLVRPGDIVYSRRGDVERRALIRKDEDGWLCGTGCLRVRPGQGSIDPAYTSYYLGHPAVRGWILRHAIGATMPNLNTSILSAVPFVVPPLIEQQKIAAVLSTFDEKIELNRGMNQTLEAMAAAVFKAWFVDFELVRKRSKATAANGTTERLAGLFPSGFQDSPLGPLPDGWSIGKVGDLAKLQRGTIDPAQSPTEVFDYYSLPAFDAGQVPAAEQGSAIKSSKTLLPQDCVLVSKLNPHIPRVWFARPRPGVRAVGSTEFLPLVPTPKANLEFLYCLANSQSFTQTLNERVTGTTGSHQRVSPDAVLAMPAIIPPDSVLEAFASLTGPMLTKLARNRSQSETLAGLRDTLLPKLLSGELRVREAESLAGAAV